MQGIPASDPGRVPSLSQPGSQADEADEMWTLNTAVLSWTAGVATQTILPHQHMDNREVKTRSRENGCFFNPKLFGYFPRVLSFQTAVTSSSVNLSFSRYFSVKQHNTPHYRNWEVHDWQKWPATVDVTSALVSVPFVSHRNGGYPSAFVQTCII